MRKVLTFFFLFVYSVACKPHQAYEIQPVSLTDNTINPDSMQRQLHALGEQVQDAQIVLLGENGHGVGTFSDIKVDLVQWLYTHHGFDTIIFESGFFECSYAWERIDSLQPYEALQDCLRYPFQHAELLPLFAFIKQQQQTDRPLHLAGMDFQGQGYDSSPRPAYLHDALLPNNPQLARALATADSALHLADEHGGKGNSRYIWAYQNQETLSKLYTEAARHSKGWPKWTLNLTQGWIDRLSIRGAAESNDTNRDLRYYELRDEWMARAVAAHADSMGTRRKVLVWLHNDHGRYGNIDSHGGKATGNYLRTWYGEQVYSIGFFMGAGTITDNGRTEYTIQVPMQDSIASFMHANTHAASYLLLRENPLPTINSWANTSQPYLRMGLTPHTMVPAAEFDALFFVHSVNPPNYRLR
ncbi:MAG: erythromycin esterase family protein [Bacteroidota bacterium]